MPVNPSQNQPISSQFIIGKQTKSEKSPSNQDQKIKGFSKKQLEWQGVEKSLIKLENKIALNPKDTKVLQKLGDIYLKRATLRQGHNKKLDLVHSAGAYNKSGTSAEKPQKMLFQMYIKSHNLSELREAAEELTGDGKENLVEKMAMDCIQNGDLLSGMTMYQGLGKEFSDFTDALKGKEVKLPCSKGAAENIWEEIECGVDEPEAEWGDLGFKINQQSQKETKVGGKHRVKSAMTKEMKALQKEVDSKKYSFVTSGGELSVSAYRPSKSNAINQEKADLWVNLHPDKESKKVARVVINNTTHVSFSEFNDALKESVDDFNSQLKEGERYIVGVKENKSNLWALNLSLGNLKELPFDVVDLNKIDGQYLKDNNIDKVLFMDDASYSGEQLSTFIKDNVPADAKTEVSVVVPFLTSFAEKGIALSSVKCDK